MAHRISEDKLAPAHPSSSPSPSPRTSNAESVPELRDLLSRTEPFTELDHEEMERLGWVNVGYKHDYDKARRAMSHCKIPGFETMSLDAAIYWLRNASDIDESAQAAGNSAHEHVAKEWAELALRAMQALRAVQAGTTPVETSLAALAPYLAHCQDISSCAGIAVQAPEATATQPLPQGGHGWTVREHRGRDGELLDCFLEAPKEGDMPYGLEVLGDDYTGYGGVERKLAHCQLIAGWANGTATLDARLQGMDLSTEAVRTLLRVYTADGDTTAERDIGFINALECALLAIDTVRTDQVEGSAPGAASPATDSSPADAS